MPSSAAPPIDRQADQVRRQLRQLVEDLASCTPEQRLATVAQVRGSCEELLSPALLDAMAAARDQGWGLRRIGAASHYSHEQVRSLLARNPDGQSTPVR
ncbi:hypothetical protein [Streptomyces sp. NPDC058694]|uniref:hypothetical protein n=1 Tax=Streptomyces sp. NPDC058694 TaxID=3346603 RepID=UPI0036659D6F